MSKKFYIETYKKIDNPIKSINIIITEMKFYYTQILWSLDRNVCTKLKNKLVQLKNRVVKS